MQKKLSLSQLREKARLIRRHIIITTTAAGSGHPSSSLSAVEILVALYFGGVLRHDPSRPDWPDRDRFILSKGHGCPVLYAVLAERGYFPIAWLSTLRQIGSPLEGHPNMLRVPGLEASTGSLGQGLSIGLGHALAARLDGRDYRVYVLLGDGECDEGQVWEAAMGANKYKVDNLAAIMDYNHYQQTGYLPEVMPLEPLKEKWRAFGWHTIEIDGHDFEALFKAFEEAKATNGQPTVIIAHTVKGKGVSLIEKDRGNKFHGVPLTTEQAEVALKEIEEM
ncbi:MAG: transketolase [Anaerolineae bacterium]